MNQPYSKLRVIIADDHEMVRDGLHLMMNKIADLEVVGEASNGEQLVKQVEKLLPDIVLTDVKMPVMDGITATKKIKEQWPHIGIIALSSFDEESLIMDMLNAGATGYLLKNTSKKELREAVLAVYRGESYYCKETNERLAQIVAKGGIDQGKSKTGEQFTERELEVIGLICEGLSSKLIADKLGLKRRTVERYRDSIMEKMEVRNSPAVVFYAVKHGLYNPVTEKK